MSSVSGPSGSEVVEDAPESTDEVRDLDVGAAHRRGRVVAAEDAGEHRVQVVVLGLLVRVELLDQEALHVAHERDRLGRPRDVELVGHVADAREVGP